MIITIEDILITQEVISQAVKPFREELQKAKDQFAAKADEFTKVLLDQLDEYYDQELRDLCNDPVRIDDLLTHYDKPVTLKVTDRYMQFAFGQPLGNPRVVCKKTKDQGETVFGREIHLFRSDLSNYRLTVIKDGEGL